MQVPAQVSENNAARSDVAVQCALSVLLVTGRLPATRPNSPGQISSRIRYGYVSIEGML